MVKQLVALVIETVVDTSEGELPWYEGVDRYGIVLDNGFLLVLWQQVNVVLEACAGHFDVVVRVGEVSEDDGVVAFDLVDINAVVSDATIFLDLDFIAEPIGKCSITIVYCGV